MTAPQLPPGAVIAGKYQVAALLTQGGSSNTYYCRGAGNIEVVAKVFDPAMRQRADIMQMVEQVYGQTNAMPAELVARIVDAGYDPATMAPFSVTERVQLPSLAQMVSQRPLAPEETIGMLHMLAHILDGAHAMQLAHHALKPTNIFVGLGPPMAIRVTDFGAGLARLAVPTAEGYALAAPWLAPEQVQQGMQAGPAADVFATALCVFFALTGRSYFRSCQGPPDLAGWQREIISPRDPASVRAGQFGVPLNPAFDSVLGAALSVDPQARYRSVGEFTAALDSVAGARSPEIHTVAFPVAPGEYPPPPPPLAAMVGPHGLYGAPSMQPGQGGGGPTLHSAGVADARPANAPPPRPTSTKIAPIVVIVVVVLLLGGGAAALALMGKSNAKTDDGPIAVAASSPSATPAVSGEATADPASSAPSPSAAPSTEPAAAGTASAAGPDGIEVALTCDPACDEMKVDDKPVEDLSKSLTLPPGKHKIYVAKATFYPQNDTITVVAGHKFEKQYHLVPVAKTSATSKPCGKFLKRCN